MVKRIVRLQPCRHLSKLSLDKCTFLSSQTPSNNLLTLTDNNVLDILNNNVTFSQLTTYHGIELTVTVIYHVKPRNFIKLHAEFTVFWGETVVPFNIATSEPLVDQCGRGTTAQCSPEMLEIFLLFYEHGNEAEHYLFPVFIHEQ